MNTQYIVYTEKTKRNDWKCINDIIQIILPPFDQIEKSSYQLNITDVYDTTHFPIESSSKSGGSNDLLIIDPWIFFYNGLFAFIGLQRMNI